MTAAQALASFLDDRYIGNWVKVRGKQETFQVVLVELEAFTGDYEMPYFTLHSQPIEKPNRRRRVYLDQEMPPAYPTKPLL